MGVGGGGSPKDAVMICKLHPQWALADLFNFNALCWGYISLRHTPCTSSHPLSVCLTSPFQPFVLSLSLFRNFSLVPFLLLAFHAFFFSLSACFPPFTPSFPILPLPLPRDFISPSFRM